MYTAKLCTIQGYLCRHKGLDFKGTVSVISSDPPCQDVNARLTAVALKP